MKYFSAAVIVVAGVALVISSQWCAASIMKNNEHYTTNIASQGVSVGICIIVAGMIGWGYALWSRTDS